jgi:hypothetical protein
MTAIDRPMPGWLEAAWLQRYLERELTPDESEWFEVYVLDKPDLLARIEADLDLRDGVASSGTVTATATGTDVPLQGAAPPRKASGGRRRARPVEWFARAAVVMVSVSLGWWAATSSVTTDPAGGDVIVDPVRIVFDTQRGAEDAPLVFNGSSASRYLLVEVGVPADATDVRLLDGSEPARALTVTSEGFVTFLWPRAGKDSAPPSLSYRTDGSTVTRNLDLSRVLKGEKQ